MRFNAARLGWKKVLRPNQGVLTGLGPVYMAKSYSTPPNKQPQKGATIGTQK